MNKQETSLFKGVAILMMVFYHLFNQLSNVSLCEPFVFIGSLPLVHILSRAASPVSFFLILGGYGMYCVYLRGDQNRLSRVLRLFLHYWLISLVFILIGIICFQREVPTIGEIIANITGYQVTWNEEMWFLLPYIILVLLSPLLFSLTPRFKSDCFLLVALFFVNLTTSFLVSYCGVSFLFHSYWAYNPLLVFHLMFPFYLGAMTAKYQLFSIILNKLNPIRKYCWLILLLLIAFRCCFLTSAFHTFYVYAFIVLALTCQRPVWLDRCLSYFGKHSMNIWMIHTYFCYYLFKDFIYGFRYPILIFIVLTTLSLLSSILVNAICSPLENQLKTIQSK